MPEVKSIVVYCGSCNGAEAQYTHIAESLAKTMAQQGLTLIYGGGNLGLMGVMANTALEHGGKVIGVIPKMLDELEVAHKGLDQLFIVDDMHQRKAKMASLADAVIALPGGLGTLEELFEALTWTQLGFHAKPCGLINQNGYFDHLLHFLDHTVDQQFVSQKHRDLLVVENDPATLIQRLSDVKFPDNNKWI